MLLVSPFRLPVPLTRLRLCMIPRFGSPQDLYCLTTRRRSTAKLDHPHSGAACFLLTMAPVTIESVTMALRRNIHPTTPAYILHPAPILQRGHASCILCMQPTTLACTLQRAGMHPASCACIPQRLHAKPLGLQSKPKALPKACPAPCSPYAIPISRPPHPIPSHPSSPHPTPLRRPLHPPPPTRPTPSP